MKLIAVCRKSGVKAFKHGDIEFSFHQEAQAWPETNPNQELKQIDEQDNALLEETKLNNLLLENPVAYEEMMAEKLIKN